MTLPRFGFARACAAFLLIAAGTVCLARSVGAPGNLQPVLKLAHTVRLLPGMVMTPQQYEQYRRQLEQLRGGNSRAQPDFAGALDSNLLLAARVIDDQSAIESIAVTDVTGDARADIVAFGARPSPNQSYRRISIYPQTADGDIGAPIHSDVNSQVPIRPEGMIATPIFGARPDLLIFGHRWLEICQLTIAATVPMEPLRITLNTIVRDVAVRDVNGDGRPDLIVSGNDYDDVTTPLKVQRFLQTATGSFTQVSDVTLPFTAYGVEGTLVDIDGDGIVDVINGISANDSFGFGYRLGLPDGTYGPLLSVLESANQFVLVRRISVTDMDGDGLKDVVLATGDGARVCFQVSTGTFVTVPLPTSAPVINVSQVSRADLDGNGLVDVIMWLDGYDRLQVDVQTAPQSFAAVSQYEVPVSYASFFEDTTVAADVNSDGRPDVLTLSGGLSVLYNGTGSYPTLDSSLVTSAQVDDSGPIAHIQWQHTVTNAGAAILEEGFLLQDMPAGFEFIGANVPCAYFVKLVACAVPVLSPAQAAQITIHAKSVSRRVNDGNAISLAAVFVGGRPIDPNLANNSAQSTVFVRAHPEGLQTAAAEVFVYESAGDTAIPVVDAPPASGLTRFMNYWLFGENASDGTGIAGALNGTVWSAPGQEGPSRIRITTRDGSTVNSPLHFTVQFSDGGFSSPGGNTLTIVDDDGTDPRLTASGAQPFEEWPAVFSSVTTLFNDAAPATVAIGDVDGDGRNDVAVSFGASVSGTALQVWLQQPNGSLAGTPLTWNAPYNGAIASIAIGDVTGDGQPELVVPLFDQFSIVRLVNGQLQAVDSAQVSAWKVAVSDLNLDGYLDIVVVDNAVQSFDGPQYWLPNVSIFYGNPQRTLDPAPYRFGMPYAGRNNLIVGLFNRDAFPDIAITSGQGNFPSVSIAYQNANGTFAAPIGIWVAGPQHLDGLGFGDSITTGDFNGDGRADFAIGSLIGLDVPSVWIFNDLRNDDFASPSQRLYAGPEGNLAAIDINQDGRDDLLVDVAVFPGSPGSAMGVYLQDATGKLQYSGSLPGWGAGQHTNWMQTMAVGDIDGDGEQDVVVLAGVIGHAAHILHSRAYGQTVQFSSLESASVVVGARARYRMRVVNNGTRTSLEIPLSWSLPANLGSAQIVAAKGACYRTVAKGQCLLPQLAPGGHVDVMLTGAFSSAGTFPMSISAGPDGSYGQATMSAVVTSGGGGSGGGGGAGGGASQGGGGGAFDVLTLFLLALIRLVAPSEPPRDFRRLFRVTHAAMA